MGQSYLESDAAEMNVFMQKCLQLLPVLGLSELSDKIDPISEVQDLLYCNIKGLSASGKRTANGFLVFFWFTGSIRAPRIS